MTAVRGFLLRALPAAVLAGVLLACHAMDDPAPAAIDGTWLYHETMIDQLYSVTCNDTGTYTFNQTGAKFTGSFVQTGRCVVAGAKQFNDGHGNVTDGSVTSVHVQFTAGGTCSYTGLLSTAHDAVNAGTGICDFVDSSTARHYSLQINWDMTRQ